VFWKCASAFWRKFSLGEGQATTNYSDQKTFNVPLCLCGLSMQPYRTRSLANLKSNHGERLCRVRSRQLWQATRRSRAFEPSWIWTKTKRRILFLVEGSTSRLTSLNNTVLHILYSTSPLMSDDPQAERRLNCLLVRFRHLLTPFPPFLIKSSMWCRASGASSTFNAITTNNHNFGLKPRPKTWLRQDAPFVIISMPKSA